MTKKISDAIVQTKFRNDYHKANLALAYASSQLQALHQDFMKKFGLSLQQFNVLRILRGQQPNVCNLILIKERMIDKSSDVSRLVEKLRISGYVDRCLNESNRRNVDVKISKSGLKLLSKIDVEMDVLEEPMHQLDIKEAKQLTQLLEKLIK